MGSLTETACAGDEGRTQFFGGRPRPLLGCVGVDIADVASSFVLLGAATFEEDTGAKTGKILLLSPVIAARFEYLEERIQYGDPPFPGIVLEPQEAEERLRDTSEQSEC